MNPVEILLVEDNDADAELALHALKKANIGNRIHVVRDGQEALNFIFGTGEHEKRGTENPPKLILLDLKLPKIDGLQVLRRIKENPKTRFIPVTVLTASREEKDMIESYQLGVNSYIQKPVDFDQFRTTVQQLGLYWLVVNQLPSSGPTSKTDG
jgi:two-component system, response regulator